MIGGQFVVGCCACWGPPTRSASLQTPLILCFKSAVISCMVIACPVWTARTIQLTPASLLLCVLGSYTSTLFHHQYPYFALPLPWCWLTSKQAHQPNMYGCRLPPLWTLVFIHDSAVLTTRQVLGQSSTSSRACRKGGVNLTMFDVPDPCCACAAPNTWVLCKTILASLILGILSQSNSPCFLCAQNTRMIIPPLWFNAVSWSWQTLGCIVKCSVRDVFFAFLRFFKVLRVWYYYNKIFSQFYNVLHVQASRHTFWLMALSVNSEPCILSKLAASRTSSLKALFCKPL
jgi:hypothetical protein